MKFRKKEELIEATCFTYDDASIKYLKEWLDDCFVSACKERHPGSKAVMRIAVGGGIGKVIEGDWIIKGEPGEIEFYIHDADAFVEMYEPVHEGASQPLPSRPQDTWKRGDKIIDPDRHTDLIFQEFMIATHDKSKLMFRAYSGGLWEVEGMTNVSLEARKLRGH